MEATSPLSREELWSPSDSLSPRVKKLRDEYFSFSERDYFKNEIMPFTTGTEWDEMFSPVQWGVVPELVAFFPCLTDSLPPLAEKVELPPDFWDKPMMVREASFFEKVISRHIPIKILKGELIVGGQFNTAMSKAHNRKEHRKWRKQMDKWFKRYEFINSHGIGNTGAMPGHLIPNYRDAIKGGLEARVKHFRDLMKEARDQEHKDFLEALIICCQGARDLATRYSGEARRLAGETDDPKRKEELSDIARICEKVPWEPAETFHEALQSLWFIHMLVMAAESFPGPGTSPGRVDQYLYEYYRRDMEEGRITRDEAKELLECFWIKPNYAYDYLARAGPNQGITSGYGQLVTLGGIGPDGEDASNDLTWLMLEVIEEMNLLEPKPNIRLHRKTPEDLLRRVAEILARAQGSPFLMNFDENAMRGLEWQGLPKEELWDYAPVGCLENTLQGNDRSGTVDVNVNLAKAVELTLFNGKDQKTGKRIGPRTGKVTRMKSWPEFREAFEKQLKAMIRLVLDVSDRADYIRATYEPTPYLSALVDGCAESGKDVTQGGPVHNYITVQGIAFGTAADSLAAIKKLVYHEEKISMGELVQAIEDNYEGHERLRQLLLNRAPKYGNDDDYADGIARYLSRLWTEYVFSFESPATKRRYRGGYLSWNYWIAYAPSTAATPDGRPRGTFLSNGIGPVDGSDQEGPTAVTLSVGKLGLETAPNGASHTLSLSPSLVRGEEHIEKLMSYLRAYGEKGGTALQLNIIDPDTLREAQRRPMDYRNLLVRITGYNAYFVMIGKELQDEIIARESHRL